MAGIAVHWEAAPPRSDHGRCASQVEEIRSYHKRNGYTDIAYSFLVCNHGQVFTGRGWGRQSAATCNGTNNARYPIAVCWMGGPGYSPTQAALAGIRSVIDEARARGYSDVIPHSSACATQCPGDDLRAWIRNGLPAVGVPSPEEDDLPDEATFKDWVADTLRWEMFVDQEFKNAIAHEAQRGVALGLSDGQNDDLSSAFEAAVKRAVK